jgi:hypothetical protein
MLLTTATAQTRRDENEITNWFAPRSICANASAARIISSDPSAIEHKDSDPAGFGIKGSQFKGENKNLFGSGSVSCRLKNTLILGCISSPRLVTISRCSLSLFLCCGRGRELGKAGRGRRSPVGRRRRLGSLALWPSGDEEGIDDRDV